MDIIKKLALVSIVQVLLFSSCKTPASLSYGTSIIDTKMKVKDASGGPVDIDVNGKTYTDLTNDIINFSKKRCFLDNDCTKRYSDFVSDLSSEFNARVDEINNKYFAGNMDRVKVSNGRVLTSTNDHEKDIEYRDVWDKFVTTSITALWDFKIAITEFDGTSNTTMALSEKANIFVETVSPQNKKKISLFPTFAMETTDLEGKTIGVATDDKGFLWVMNDISNLLSCDKTPDTITCNLIKDSKLAFKKTMTTYLDKYYPDEDVKLGLVGKKEDRMKYVEYSIESNAFARQSIELSLQARYDAQDEQEGLVLSDLQKVLAFVSANQDANANSDATNQDASQDASQTSQDATTPTPAQ